MFYNILTDDEPKAKISTPKMRGFRFPVFLAGNNFFAEGCGLDCGNYAKSDKGNQKIKGV